MSNFILGVTGGIGSGKSAATDFFARLGIVVVDADIISREIVEPDSPALNSIAEHFGSNILNAEGALDREQLRHIIFHHPQEKEWLEALLHPLIRETIQQQLAEATSPYVILSAPLLLDTNLHTITDRVLVIDCDETTQIQRASQRDNNKPETIKAIMAQQLSRKARLEKANDVIDNSGSLADLERLVSEYHQGLMDSLADKL